MSSERGGYFTKSPLYLDDGVAWAEVTVGLLTSAADECLTLGVSSSLRPEVQAVRVAIGRDACN